MNLFRDKTTNCSKDRVRSLSEGMIGGEFATEQTTNSRSSGPARGGRASFTREVKSRPRFPLEEKKPRVRVGVVRVGEWGSILRTLSRSPRPSN